MITPSNLVRHELIGLPVKVKRSSNKSVQGMKGRVVWETYNLLYIETGKGVEKILKSSCIFIFKLPNGSKVQVDGKLLLGRPEDRIKKKIPRWDKHFL